MTLKEKETELEKAIGRLKIEYNAAVTLPFVRNPIAYALYYTWKAFDEEGSHDG